MLVEFELAWYEIAEREWWEAHPSATQEEFERDFEISRV